MAKEKTLTPSANASKKDASRVASFEEMMDEVETLTRFLEEDDVPLEEALDAFEKASVALKSAEKILERGQARLFKLMSDDEDELFEVEMP